MLKTLMEKLRLIDSLNNQKNQSLFKIVDDLIAKKKVKGNLIIVLPLSQ